LNGSSEFRGVSERIRERLRSFSRYATSSRALDYLVLLIFSVVVTRLWLVGNATPVGGDFAAIPFHPSQTMSRYSSAWNFWIDGGNPIPSIISNQVSPVDLLFYEGLDIIGLPIAWIQTIYVILFSYYLGSVSSYLLARVLFETRVAAIRLASIITGMFYVLNPVAVYSAGYVFILGSALPRASLPLSLYLLIAGVKKRDLRYAIALSLASILMFTVFARAIELGFFLLISLALVLPYIPRIIRKHDLSAVKFAAEFSAVFSITAVAVNLFWIVPFVWNYGFFQTELTNFSTTFVNVESQFSSLTNVIRLQGSWTLFVGTYVPYASYFAQPAVIVATFAIPALAIFGLQPWRRQSREIYSLGFVLALCLALGLGTNLPFNIFQTIVGIPFLKLFKDPWIFMEPLSLVYSILFGLSFAHIYRFMMPRIKRPDLTKLVALAIALLILGSVSLPVLSGNVYTNWYQPSQKGVLIPSQYSELNSWLQQHPCDCQTMIVPELAGTYIATSWGYQGTNIIYQNLLTNSLVTGYGPAIYGIQPDQSKTLIDYVYTLLSHGNPLSSPYPLNGTNTVQDWHYSTASQSSSDSLVALNTTDPWANSSLNWTFAPLDEPTLNGHQIFYKSNATLDLSDRHWVLFWAKSTVGWSNFAFGIGDSSTTGWYTMSSHILESEGAWSLFAFPTSYPDSFYYNSSRSLYFVLGYGRFADPSVAMSGSGVLSLGALYISHGTVSENTIRFFLQALNVKYMVFDSSLDGNLYSYLNLRPYLETFSNWTTIKPVAMFGNLTVYENPSQGSLVSMPAYWFHASSLLSVPAQLDLIGSRQSPGAFIVSTDGDSQPIMSGGVIRSVTQVGASQFLVRASINGSALLVLSTAFDPSWQATANNRAVLTHALVNGYANGWFLQGTGDITITIINSHQTLYQISVLVSIFAIFVACTLLFLKLRPVSKEVTEKNRTATF
jgi:hypothetical protein